MMYSKRLIDLDDYKVEDLTIKNLEGGMLSIEATGTPTVSIAGKHTDLNEGFNLGLINMTSLSKVDSITEAGLYLCPISGLDEVTLTVSGSGKLNIKDMGD